MRRSAPAFIVWTLVGAALIAVGAQLDVPMHPVPMSLQSLALLAAGVVGGWRIGLAASLLYLTAGALGAPVFAGGSSGWDALTGPTAGYLIGFPIAAVAAALICRLKPKHLAFIAGLAGHALILGLGWVWLAQTIGAQAAWSGGVQPFLIGAIAKSAALALIAFVTIPRGLLKT
jgi:biotin transport system substrate-specific component